MIETRTDHVLSTCNCDWGGGGGGKKVDTQDAGCRSVCRGMLEIESSQLTAFWERRSRAQ